MPAIRSRDAPPSRARAARPGSLLYVYCVLESGTPAQALLDQGRIPSLLMAEPVFGIEAAGLVAAVSWVPAATFGEAPLNALVADLNQVTPYAVHHETVIRALAEAAPSVVPIGFGAVYRDPARVARFLARRADDLSQLLERLRGRQE